MSIQLTHDSPSTDGSKVALILQRPPVPLPLVPKPTIGCPICSRYAWSPCLLKYATRLGRSTWECGYCHPEVISSGGYEYHFPDVATLRKEIAALLHGQPEKTPEPPATLKIPEPPAPQAKRPYLTHIPSQELTPYPLYWFDRETRILIEDDSDQEETLEPGTCSNLLARIAQARKQRVFVLGGDTALNALPQSWYKEASKQGWEIVDQHKDHKLLIFKRDNQEVILYMTALWYPGMTDIRACKRAYHATEQVIRKRFGPSTYLFSTPTRAGKDILERHLPFGQRYPILPESELALLHHSGYQGRIETFGSDQAMYTDLYNLDGVFMYAACGSWLPVGPYVHDQPSQEVNPKDRFIPGFYRATFTVPPSWSHIGLIKAPREVQDIPSLQRYPNQPGETITNWVSSTELYLAYDQGWNPRIHERLYWPETSKHKNVLENWLYPLRDIRLYAKQGTYGEYSPQIADATRAIVLGTIGSFFSHARLVRHVTPYSEQSTIPAYARRPRPLAYGIEWWISETIKPTKWTHPEWSASVWGRARARLASMALKLPYASLVALRTDGIWTTAKPDEYDNRGNVITKNDPERAKKLLTPGSWRIKHAYHTRIDSPTDNASMVSLMQRLRNLEEEIEDWETDQGEGEE